MENNDLQDPDSALVAAARGGSKSAFIEIVRRHQASVRAYIGSHLHARVVADDIAQETFVSAFRSLGSFREDAPLRTWLIGIARHRVLDQLRQEVRATHRLAPLRIVMLREIEMIESNEGHESRRALELDALQDCLAALPTRSAQTIAAHYFEARPLVDLAREKGRQPGAVRAELLRIRQALRRCIESKLAAAASEA